MRYSLITLLSTVLLLHSQSLQALVIPQVADVHAALTIANPATITTKGALLATTPDNLYLLKELKQESASVVRIAPDSSDGDVYNAIDKDGNVRATLTLIWDRNRDNGPLLAWIKAQKGSNTLIYTAKNGTRISFNASAAKVGTAAAKSSYMMLQSMSNGTPYIVFKNGTANFGRFLLSVAL